jgi:hypothetical protein
VNNSSRPKSKRNPPSPEFKQNLFQCQEVVRFQIKAQLALGNWAAVPIYSQNWRIIYDALWGVFRKLFLHSGLPTKKYKKNLLSFFVIFPSFDGKRTFWCWGKLFLPHLC